MIIRSLISLRAAFKPLFNQALPSLRNNSELFKTDFYFPFALLNLQFSLFKRLYFTKWCQLPRRNAISGRVYSVQYAANDPMEDTFDWQDIGEDQGFLTIVCDGHGGLRVAELVTQKLSLYFKESFNSLDGSKTSKIIKAINQAFNKIQFTFLSTAREEFSNGSTSVTRVGACVLAAIVADNKLISANVGDCRGLIVSKDGQKGKFTKINNKLNASNKKQQLRLLKQFPNDADIVVCRANNPLACYVKNKLQPTRSIGDLSLKYKEFTLSNSKFNGPYISHQPQIMQFDLGADDLFLVMASDGLWDELTKKQVMSLVLQHSQRKQLIASKLLEAAVKKVSVRSRLSEESLEQVPLGHLRRNIHDDITVLVVDLQGQYKAS